MKYLSPYNEAVVDREDLLDKIAHAYEVIVHQPWKERFKTEDYLPPHFLDLQGSPWVADRTFLKLDYNPGRNLDRSPDDPLNYKLYYLYHGATAPHHFTLNLATEGDLVKLWAAICKLYPEYVEGEEMGFFLKEAQGKELKVSSAWLHQPDLYQDTAAYVHHLIQKYGTNDSLTWAPPLVLTTTKTQNQYYLSEIKYKCWADDECGYEFEYRYPEATGMKTSDELESRGAAWLHLFRAALYERYPETQDWREAKEMGFFLTETQDFMVEILYDLPQDQSDAEIYRHNLQTYLLNQGFKWKSPHGDWLDEGVRDAIGFGIHHRAKLVLNFSQKYITMTNDDYPYPQYTEAQIRALDLETIGEGGEMGFFLTETQQPPTNDAKANITACFQTYAQPNKYGPVLMVKQPLPSRFTFARTYNNPDGARTTQYIARYVNQLWEHQGRLSILFGATPQKWVDVDALSPAQAQLVWTAVAAAYPEYAEAREMGFFLKEATYQDYINFEDEYEDGASKREWVKTFYFQQGIHRVPLGPAEFLWGCVIPGGHQVFFDSKVNKYFEKVDNLKGYYLQHVVQLIKRYYPEYGEAQEMGFFLTEVAHPLFSDSTRRKLIRDYFNHYQKNNTLRLDQQLTPELYVSSLFTPANRMGDNLYRIELRYQWTGTENPSHAGNHMEIGVRQDNNFFSELMHELRPCILKPLLEYLQQTYPEFEEGSEMGFFLQENLGEEFALGNRELRAKIIAYTQQYGEKMAFCHRLVFEPEPELFNSKFLHALVAAYRPSTTDPFIEYRSGKKMSLQDLNGSSSGARPFLEAILTLLRTRYPEFEEGAEMGFFLQEGFEHHNYGELKALVHTYFEALSHYKVLFLKHCTWQEGRIIYTYTRLRKDKANQLHVYYTSHQGGRSMSLLVNLLRSEELRAILTALEAEHPGLGEGTEMGFFLQENQAYKTHLAKVLNVGGNMNDRREYLLRQILAVYTGEHDAEGYLDLGQTPFEYTELQAGEIASGQREFCDLEELSQTEGEYHLWYRYQDDEDLLYYRREIALLTAHLEVLEIIWEYLAATYPDYAEAGEMGFFLHEGRLSKNQKEAQLATEAARQHNIQQCHKLLAFLYPTYGEEGEDGFKLQLPDNAPRLRYRYNDRQGGWNYEIKPRVLGQMFQETNLWERANVFCAIQQLQAPRILYEYLLTLYGIDGASFGEAEEMGFFLHENWLRNFLRRAPSHLQQLTNLAKNLTQITHFGITQETLGPVFSMVWQHTPIKITIMGLGVKRHHGAFFDTFTTHYIVEWGTERYYLDYTQGKEGSQCLKILMSLKTVAWQEAYVAATGDLAGLLAAHRQFPFLHPEFLAHHPEGLEGGEMGFY